MRPTTAFERAPSASHPRPSSGQRPGLILAALLVIISALGCPSPPKGGECRSAADCEAQAGFGRVCVQGRCVECAADGDCQAGWRCAEARCQPGGVDDGAGSRGGRPECASTADCPAGRSCLAGRCQAEPGTAPDAGPTEPAAPLERFPSLAAPEVVEPRQSFQATFALTVQRTVSGVEITRGPATPEGALRLDLPPSADGWEVMVFLIPTGLEVVGSNVGLVRLKAEGDSTQATFALRAPPSATPADRPAELAVELYLRADERSRYLGSVRRQVMVRATQPTAGGAGPSPAAPARAVSRPALALDASVPAPTATLGIQTSIDPINKVETTSYTFVPAGGPPVFLPAEPVSATLEADLLALYEQLEVVASSLAMKTAKGTPDSRRAAVLQAVRPVVARHVPARLRALLLASVRSGPADTRGPAGEATIQIVTDDPRFPWELLPVPVVGGDQPLGLVAQVSRLPRHRADPATLQAQGGARARPLRSVHAVVPPYGGRPEDWQASEVAMLRRVMPPGRLVEVVGHKAELHRLVGSAGGPEGVIHFVGHGRIERDGAAGDEFLLVLADKKTFGLADLRADRPDWSTGRPLVFLNACELGRASRAAGMVDGWFHEVLNAGASGFIGGLWGLGQDSAGDFSRRLYGALAEGRTLGAALHVARQGYLSTGDPTYLAYVLYGAPGRRLAVGEQPRGGAP